jgi:hypothetical protein
LEGRSRTLIFGRTLKGRSFLGGRSRTLIFGRTLKDAHFWEDAQGRSFLEGRSRTLMDESIKNVFNLELTKMIFFINLVSLFSNLTRFFKIRFYFLFQIKNLKLFVLRGSGLLNVALKKELDCF